MAKIVTIGYGSATKQLIATSGYGTDLQLIIPFGDPICWLRRDVAQTVFQRGEIETVFRGELTEVMFQRAERESVFRRKEEPKFFQRGAEELFFRDVKPCKT